MNPWRSAILLLLLQIALVAGADSPQFRGAQRDGRFLEQGLLKSWSPGQPKLNWVATGMGKGYSSASIAGGQIFVSGMDENQNGHVSVLDMDGKLVRSIPYGSETTEAQAPGARSTPTVEGGRLYLLSGPGVLYCLDVASGDTVWSVNILERFGGELPIWHMAESVLLDGDHVICTPGGSRGLMAALDKSTGETVWATTGLEDKASYCSPTIFIHGNRRILTTATGRHIIGVDPDTGKLLWSFEHIAPYDIHGVTPIYHDGSIYYVGGEKAGGGLLKLSEDGSAVTPVWTDMTLDCLHHGVVLVDGYLYGTGYRDGGQLVCLEWATGKVMWTTRDVRLGVTVYADGMLYVYEGPKSGIVSLIKAVSAGFEPAGRFEVTEGGNDKHWAHPTIVDGCLYIRHGDALMAYDVRK